MRCGATVRAVDYQAKLDQLKATYIASCARYDELLAGTQRVIAAAEVRLMRPPLASGTTAA